MLTELVLIVDRSGSMASLVKLATDAINRLIQDQCDVGNDYVLTIVMFSDDSKVICDALSVKIIPQFDTKIFSHMGGTALLDAVGFTIKHLEERKQKSDKTIIVVLTDGDENQSRTYTEESIAKEILNKEIEGWEFIYMIACNHNLTRSSAMHLAAKLGFAMIMGVNSNEYAHSIEQISKHISRLRESNTCTNYAVPLAKSGYSREMKSGKFSARLMRAPRLKGEKSGSLPPGAPIPVFPVDALPGCPADWVGGEGSYVCPVEPEWGLWFDWTDNDTLNTAVIASVKGMNPITGQKLEKLKLEKFKKCPIHKVEFKAGHLCEKCGYSWPMQSYVAHPNELWWDGFRQADGSVRQFFFSADEARDVAAAVIGKKNTVPAFGFAFFQPKEKRVAAPPSTVWRYSPLRSAGRAGGQSVRRSVSSQGLIMGSSCSSCSIDDEVMLDNAESAQSAIYMTNSVGPTGPVGLVGAIAPSAQCEEVEEKTIGPILQVVRAAQVAVGAGAEISQELQEDELDVKDWQQEPAGLIRLYFVFPEQFKSIIKKGIRDLRGKKAGYLEGIPVG